MRSMLRWLLLAVVAGATIPGPASAQIPLPFFKKKKKPPAEAGAPKGPQETPAPGAPAPPPAATPAGPGEQAPAAAAPAQAPGAASAVTLPPPPPAAPGTQAALTPEEKQALDQAINQAIAADGAADTSQTHINERITRWLQVLVRDPQNPIATMRLNQAQQDLQAAKTAAAAQGNADKSTKTITDGKKQQARVDIAGKNWGGARKNLEDVLQAVPNDAEAVSLMSEVQRGQRLDDVKRQAMYIIPVLVILAAGLVVVVKWGAKYREERQQKADELAAKRQAVLQIVDGVGRGKLVTIDKDKAIFKIGAAAGPGEAEKNDLVISDSATLVSRFHCTLVRKDGNYYLVDASVNGTMVNGDGLKRGEHHLLEDGDEITVAEVSRLKFLHT